MFTRISSATAETASSLSSTIHSTLTSTSTIVSSKLNDNYPNLSRNLTDNYSNLSGKVADNYNKFSENYPYFYSSLTNTRSTINNGTTYIYSLPGSIGDKIYSYASIFEPVDGSEEREVTRVSPNENLGENVIPLNEERIELVNDILGLYSNPTKESFKYYADDVIYEDQLMLTSGLPNLKAQFYGMPKIPVKSTIINYKILENTLNVLKISLNQRYLIPFVGRAFVLNSVVILEFNESKKISKHMDLWYGKQPVGKGEILRKGAAKIVSTLVKIPEN